ncbi:Spermidine/putrescine transport system permease protein PotB [bioreactor metagenome]|uniref:Spermidine/putrescine transport system permease protein PotB n=1 Tax=bioreactor metagenome TaxID=1076179 RepID=A0A645E0D7_9ZZZZ|nr:ABC transporter permease [Candidatus Metalachnospira sp.]
MNKKDRIPILATVSPATVWLVIFVAVPLFYIVLISFSAMENRKIVYEFTLENYKDVFSMLYASVYFDSFVIAFFNTVVCILVGYPMAYFIAKAPKKKQKLYSTLLMIPFYTNLVIRLNGWRQILDKSGYINKSLLTLHIVSDPIQFMNTRGAVILGMVYALLPFMVLPLISSINNLDKTLLEASYDLGLGKVKTFLHVTLPLTKPGIFSGTIMVFIPTMAYFFISDILGGGTHKLIGNLIQLQFNQSYNWPLGAAFSVILIVLTLILVFIYKRSGGKMDSLV